MQHAQTMRQSRYNRSHNSGNTNVLGTIFILGIALLIIAIFCCFAISRVMGNALPAHLVEPMELSVSEIRIVEVLSGHAWEKHGAEVSAAFQCLGENGSAMSFKTKGFVGRGGNYVPTSLWLCKNPKTGEWFAIVTTHFRKVMGNKVAQLVTAYRVAEDIFPHIDDYIDYVKTYWGAIPINYVIDAGDILLQPR